MGKPSIEFGQHPRESEHGVHAVTHEYILIQIPTGAPIRPARNCRCVPGLQPICASRRLRTSDVQWECRWRVSSCDDLSGRSSSRRFDSVMTTSCRSTMSPTLLSSCSKAAIATTRVANCVSVKHAAGGAAQGGVDPSDRLKSRSSFPLPHPGWPVRGCPVPPCSAPRRWRCPVNSRRSLCRRPGGDQPQIRFVGRPRQKAVVHPTDLQLVELYPNAYLHELHELSPVSADNLLFPKVGLPAAGTRSPLPTSSQLHKHRLSLVSLGQQAGHPLGHGSREFLCARTHHHPPGADRCHRHRGVRPGQLQ